MSAPTAAEAQALLRVLTKVLCAVAVLALVFTAVNITLFARSRGIPLGIAALLDPMLSLALAAVLFADARLASWGMRPPRWSAALRWFTGIAATLMNTWEAIWPTGQIGWPIHADPARILLHGIPTILLILLTETIAAYRRVVADLLNQIGEADPPAAHSARATDSPDSVADHTEPVGPGPENTNHPYAPTTPAPQTAPGQRLLPQITATMGADAPRTPPMGPDAQPPVNGAANGDLWRRALSLDHAARAVAGRPVSLWKLRSELHIGPTRARQIHTQLLAHHRPAEPADPDPPIGRTRSAT
ncbi:extensin [Streptomyces sp. ISL-100]|uniref:extensin n=1 Tax=Streptomyces sp. ISL-100 TaxID=2819173 RepID=UPI001BEC4017|nr:extensin [Streptomyces sp. ISL-100]MBT2396672.1 extensin [Streptomyces sp. ISL-100]